MRGECLMMFATLLAAGCATSEPEGLLGRLWRLEVVDAEELLYPSETFLAQTQRDQLVAVVNLYKALGGGWQVQ